MMMIMVMIILENDKTWDEASLLRSRFWARHATLLPRGGERFVTSLKTAAKIGCEGDQEKARLARTPADQN